MYPEHKAFFTSRYLYSFELLPFRHPCKHLPGHFRKEGIRKDMIYIPGSAVDVGAASRNSVDNLLIIAEDGVFHYAEALTEEQKHAMLMKGTVNFMGFTAKEITPNEEFYITTYSGKEPDIDANAFRLRIEGMVERPYTLSFKELEAMRVGRSFILIASYI